MSSSKIINIRGSSGCGKTFLVLSLIDMLTDVEYINTNPKRKNPQLIIGNLNNIKIAILGYYDKIKCYGGVDSIKNLDDVVEYIKMAQELSCDVIIAEGGFLLNRDRKRIVEFNPTIFYIDVDWEVAYDSYLKRKHSSESNVLGELFSVPKSPDKMPQHFKKDHKSIRSVIDKLRNDSRCSVVVAPREKSLEFLLNEIGIT